MANLTEDSVTGVCCIKYSTSSIKCCALGSNVEGGYLIYKFGGNAVIVSPVGTQVIRNWYARNDAVTTAQNTSPFCQDWFIPTEYELELYTSCVVRQYYDSVPVCLWSNTTCNANCAWRMLGAARSSSLKTNTTNARAFRKVYY